MLQIVSVRFPFIEDPRQSKYRPALCLTKPVGKHSIVLIAYISTQTEDPLPGDITLENCHPDFKETGLKYTSIIRLRKIATVTASDVVGVAGELSEQWNKMVKDQLKEIFKI